MIIGKLINLFRSMQYYVIVDPADNSVTLSKKLFTHMRKKVEENEAACVFVFKLAGTDKYAFCVNPEIQQPTQLCDIQYNNKYRCIGFETLCPSVGQILYDYGLPYNKRVKLSVLVQTGPGGLTYYQFCKPYAKHFRNNT